MKPLTQPIFCSLGENCLGQGVLDRHKIASIVSPFAWGRSNIDYISKIIEEDFADFLNPAYLQHRDRYGTRLATNSKYQCQPGLFEPSVAREFEFTHHDVITSAEALQSMNRKIERFRQFLVSESPIVFFYHHRQHSDINTVIAKLNTFTSKVEQMRGAPTALAAFTQQLTPNQASRRLEFSQHENVQLFTFHTMRIWAGNDQDLFWGRVDDDLFDAMLKRVNG